MYFSLLESICVINLSIKRFAPFFVLPFNSLAYFVINKLHEPICIVLDVALGEASAHLDQSAFKVRALLDNSLSIADWFGSIHLCDTRRIYVGSLLSFFFQGQQSREL